MEQSKQETDTNPEADDAAAAAAGTTPPGEQAAPGNSAESAVSRNTEPAPQERKTFVDFLRSITLLRRKRNQARQQHSEMPSHFAQLDSVVEPKREDKPEGDEPSIRSAN